ncbi:GH1 family beta-glucosidase [Asticcacaulis sp. 201]|uniref:GH1 family beta-glucosidase n=1 Tax=Asticcacaulis sp. 201 TaxID=3028787 RepID=UPI002915CEF4|nr:GH1 family beta-glucosidase [Asticcacaulis sp. 201]MDV6330246.1 GH1 family beta-glucosidase [Asticcacaulis sp. 201]
MSLRFPDGFLWGCATAAYQIEGAPDADGKGPSIWDRYAHTPGMMVNNDTGDVACDHYHRFRDDIALMKRLGMQAYRFSLSWARILPNGTGDVNPAGLAFYSDLIDELLANEIEPIATLFHWDLPAALDDRGGWLNRDSADWFADYARVVFQAFDGRVKKWATINEPWVVSDGGYLNGTIAPGHRNRYEAPLASHNLMRAHGAAVKVYREIGRNEIGLVVNIEPKYPASPSNADVAAARRAAAYMNEQYLDPALLGTYPVELREVFNGAWPTHDPADFDLIRQPVDFIGINYYTRAVVRHADDAFLQAAVVHQSQSTYTEMNWEVFAQGLTDTLLWVRQRYGDIPIYITENGAAFYDPPAAHDGRVRDPLRADYLQKHLAAVHDAIQQGVNIKGYMVWSFMDNLEWSLGYGKRFGIVHVNFDTLERTPKDSALYYAHVIASHGEILSKPL